MSQRAKAVAVLAATGLLSAAWLGAYYFVPREVATRVEEVRWRREVRLLERVQQHEPGSWTLRSGAFNVKSETRFRGNVPCNSYRCNPHRVAYSCSASRLPEPDGTFFTRPGGGHTYSAPKPRPRPAPSFRPSSSTYKPRPTRTCHRTEYDTCWHECPDYDPWYEYDYYEWPVTLRASAEGRDHDCRWPELVNAAKDPATQRLEREERYSVTLCEDGEAPKRCHIHTPRTELEFRRFAPGAAWRTKVTEAGLCEPLFPLSPEAPGVDGG